MIFKESVFLTKFRVLLCAMKTNLYILYFFYFSVAIIISYIILYLYTCVYKCNYAILIPSKSYRISSPYRDTIKPYIHRLPGEIPNEVDLARARLVKRM